MAFMFVFLGHGGESILHRGSSFQGLKGFHFIDTEAFHMYVSSPDGYLIVLSE